MKLKSIQITTPVLFGKSNVSYVSNAIKGRESVSIILKDSYVLVEDGPVKVLIPTSNISSMIPQEEQKASKS